MSLLAELKKKLNAVYDRIDSLKAESDALDDEAYDLDVACRALEEDELYATKDLDEPLEPAEALLDHQPEAASPEFASEQGEPIEEMIATSDAVCEELSEAYTPLQIPEGFTPWSGGECPVPGQSVEYLCAADDVPVKTDRPEDWTWRHEGIPSRARIIAYRIIQPSAEAERIEDERDETWVPPPGYTYIPTQGERCVCVNLMQDGIGNFFCCNQRGETSADAERTSDESQAETAIEQTLITDDIPSIPREEIPIGAAVETYTDSGIETVKLGGQTYVVDDEPERQAETQPEAAYAPVNEDEARMWSNGFEADAKSKAEPEQDKRPFWMFAKKEPA